MEHDRTARPVIPTGLGLLPRKGLIAKRPGAAGPLPLLVGATIVVLAVVYFVTSLDSDRVTFDFDPAIMAQTWNDAAAQAGKPLLAVEEPNPRPDESGDLVFGHAWSDRFSLRGRVDSDTNQLVELSVIGDPTMVGGQLIVDAMDLLVRVTEPTLSGAERLATLQELGVVGGDPTADLRATRGNTDYVVAAAPNGTSIGMSAAPYSTFTSGRN